jgi:hypothetical protein
MPQEQRFFVKWPGVSTPEAWGSRGMGSLNDILPSLASIQVHPQSGLGAAGTSKLGDSPANSFISQGVILVRWNSCRSFRIVFTSRTSGTWGGLDVSDAANLCSACTPPHPKPLAIGKRKGPSALQLTDPLLRFAGKCRRAWSLCSRYWRRLATPIADLKLKKCGFCFWSARLP